MSLAAPDALVLGGGGILGEAWMSAVLAGLEGAGGFRASDAGGFVGTSAGSIVAAMLAAGADPATRLGRLPELPPADGAVAASDDGRGFAGSLAGAVAGPLAALALNVTAPGGRVVRRAALARAPRGQQSLRGLGRAVTDAGAVFDGRLRVCAVDLERGERVVFGAPGAPSAEVGEAVEASCAIPGVFRPVRIGDSDYVDGGAWSPTSIDAADVSRGSSLVCLNPTGSLRPGRSSWFGWIGPVSRSIAAVESAAMRRRGVEVTVIAPDSDSADAMGSNLMRSSARAAVIDAGFAQGSELAGSGVQVG
jgi:NTE family protein